MASNAPKPNIISIRRFDGGMSDDIREPSANKFNITKHFDIYTNPYRLTPYRDVVADATSQVGIGAFLFSSTSYFVGLGLVSGHNWPQLYYKTGANLITDNWALKANWTGTVSTTQYELFAEYNGFFYFWTSQALVKADITFGVGLNEAFATLTTTFRAQGLVHSSSNKLYIPYSTSSGTFIGSIDSAGTWTASEFQLPKNYRITSICEDNGYLAIGAYDVNYGNSKVFIWDLVSAQATQIIDFGPEPLYVLNNMEGSLIGISSSRPDVFSVVNAKVIIRRWAGGLPVVLNDQSSNASNAATIFPNVNFIKNNRLYFSAKIGSTAIGIYTLGRKSKDYNYAWTLDRFSTNSNSETSIIAAYLLGDILWSVHDSAGTITRTNDQSSFTATSVYESQKYRFSPNEHLDMALLEYAPLPSGATATLKYRKNEESSWTTLFSDSTANSTYHAARTVEDGSGNTPKFPEFREIQFRIESTGGAEITGFYAESTPRKKTYG